MAGARRKQTQVSTLIAQQLTDTEEDCEDAKEEKWIRCQKKNKSKKQTKSLCNSLPCNKPGDGEDPSIMCDACEKWYHSECQNVSPQAFEAIGRHDLFWLCLPCKKKVKEMTQMERRLEEKIKETEKNIIKAVEAQSVVKKMEDHIEGKIKTMEKEVMAVLGQQEEIVKEAKKTYSEIAKRGVDSQKRSTS